MEKSPTITELAKALMLFQMKMEKVSKDSDNPFFKSKYASLSHIQEAIQIPLAESGLVYSQMPDGQNGLSTILIHAESGEYLLSTYDMQPVKNDPQGRGSAITYQKRYALAATLGLNIDEDDDANAASGTTAKKETKTDDDQRPWMTDAQYKKTMDRIISGEAGVYENAKKAFRMKKEYREALENANQKKAA